MTNLDKQGSQPAKHMLEVFVVEVQNWRVIHLNKTTSAKIHCEEILFNFYKGDSKASTIKFFFVPNLGF
jgi:hypothetical protein